jgi:hypothetical protein
MRQIVGLMHPDSTTDGPANVSKKETYMPQSTDEFVCLQPLPVLAQALAVLQGLQVRSDADDYVGLRCTVLLLDLAVPYVALDHPAVQRPLAQEIDQLLGLWCGRISTRGGNLDRARTKDLLLRVRSKFELLAARPLYGGFGAKLNLASGGSASTAPAASESRQVFDLGLFLRACVSQLFLTLACKQSNSTGYLDRIFQQARKVYRGLGGAPTPPASS